MKCDNIPNIISEIRASNLFLRGPKLERKGLFLDQHGNGSLRIAQTCSVLL